jgi:branched-chain amino acid transport system substrate-binding protein
LTPQLVKLQSQHPDALMISAYGSDAGYALQDAQTLGLTLPMIGDIATSDSSVLSTPPPAGILGTPGEKNFKYQVFASTVKTSSTNSALNTMLAEIQKQGALPTNISAADS